MKAFARTFVLVILGFVLVGTAWPGHETMSSVGEWEECPLACPLAEAGPNGCCQGRNLAPPVVAIKVKVPAYQAPGKQLIYRICVENNSPSEAHHVLVRNPLPANAKFVKADPAPAVTEPELIWKFGTIGAGACREIELVLSPTNKEDVKNCTRVQFEHGQCVTTRQSAFGPGGPPIITGEPPDGDPKMPPVPPDGEAKLNLEIQGPAKQYANLAAKYFITVTNTGTASATNLLLTARLPDKGKFVSANNDGRFALNQVAWTLGTLKAGASRTVEVDMKALAAGELCIQAAALADLKVTAKPAEFCTIFGGQSAVHPGLTDSKDPIAIGETTSYQILVENQGGVPITNVQVEALLSPLLDFTSSRAPVGYKLGVRTPKGQMITFDPIASIDVGGKATLEISAKGLQPGDARCRVVIIADQLKEGGPIHLEQSTTIFREVENPKGRLLSRRKPAE